MIITTLAMATILIGKPNQFQPSQFTQQEVIVEQQISQPSTEVYIEECYIVDTLNIQVDTIDVITTSEEEINHDNDSGYIPITYDGIEIIEEEIDHNDDKGWIPIERDGIEVQEDEIPILVDTIQIQY